MPTAGQHRIVLAQCRREAIPSEANKHWRDVHSQIIRGANLILGYVQNRPLPDWWEAAPAFTCAETWFASRDEETAFMAHDFFSSVVQPDENRVVDQATAWHSSISEVEVSSEGARGKWRVLCFGGDRKAFLESVPGGTSKVLHVCKDTPGGGLRHVLSWWTDDRCAATDYAPTLDGISFVANPVAVIAPPTAGWTLTSPAHDDFCTEKERARMIRLDLPASTAPLAGAAGLRPEMFAGLSAVGEAAYANTQLPIRVIEGVRMRIAQVNGCLICQSSRTPRDRPDYRHIPELPESFYEAVADWRSSDEFSARERLAIEFADRYAADHRSLDTDEDLWNELHGEFSDSELVDLALFAGASMIGGRFAHIFGLDVACPVPAG
jgi:alkylhydroperoxidase family enzyme